MKTYTKICLLSFLLAVCCRCSEPGPEGKPAPCIEKRSEATQLIVDGKPFLVLAGELHNSSSSSRDYMKQIWPKLDSMNLNTVLAAVEWSLVEPVEGQYDFSLVDGMLEDARAHDLRLVLLWFGAWKNGQSHYAPSWVKKDAGRFPRVKTLDGKSLEILSTLGRETMETDARALAALMRHVRETDSIERTVIMVQIQNEVGILGSSRDFSEAGNNAFRTPVPLGLMNYLQQHKADLLPELLEIWARSDYRSTGTWEEVFGAGNRTDELFMAWNYASFIDYEVSAAKLEYDIPMFVNAWIVQPQDQKPGDYPSGGPQAHVLDIWRAGAPGLDLLCPDIYLPDFAGICSLYTRSGNPLFIPESRAGEQGVGQLFYAIGRHHAIGYSPFGIDGRAAVTGPVPDAYRMLEGMAPVILEAQQQGTINSVLLTSGTNPVEEIVAGDFRMKLELSTARGPGSQSRSGYAMIITLGPDEFIFAGSGIRVSFTPASPGPAIAALLRVDEGRFEDGNWIPRRRLNGDAIMLNYDLAKMADMNMTGTGIRLSGEDRNIQRVKLYRYE